MEDISFKKEAKKCQITPNWRGTSILIYPKHAALHFLLIQHSMMSDRRCTADNTRTYEACQNCLLTLLVDYILDYQQRRVAGREKPSSGLNSVLHTCPAPLHHVTDERL